MHKNTTREMGEREGTERENFCFKFVKNHPFNPWAILWRTMLKTDPTIHRVFTTNIQYKL